MGRSSPIGRAGRRRKSPNVRRVVRPEGICAAAEWIPLRVIHAAREVYGGPSPLRPVERLPAAPNGGGGPLKSSPYQLEVDALRRPSGTAHP